MKKRRDKRIAFSLGAVLLLICFSLIGSFLSDKALSYDTSVAHPNIARLAAELYNQQPGVEKLSAQDIDWIVKGAQAEDTPFRWYNHFYDPVYNRGIWFGKQYLSAKDWAITSIAQNDYALGDQSWNRALYNFYKGNREQAMLALGHIIHLLSDMAVPAHTRDDIHPSGDSYEQFVKANWDNIYPLLKDKIKFRELTNINSFFDVLAGFSNGYFYSDDTIGDKKYLIPSIGDVKVVFEKNSQGINYKYLVNFNGDKLCWEQNFSISDKNKIDLSNCIINHPLVLTSYSTQLIPKAIGYSAGLIKLFFSETAKGNKGEGVSFFQTSLLGYGNTLLGAIGNVVQSVLSSTKNTVVMPARTESAPQLSMLSDSAPQLSTKVNTANLSQNIVTSQPPVKQNISPTKAAVVPEPLAPVIEPRAPEILPTIETTTAPITQDIAISIPVSYFPIYYGGSGGGGSSFQPSNQAIDAPVNTATNTIEISTTTEIVSTTSTTSTTDMIDTNTSTTEITTTTVTTTITTETSTTTTDTPPPTTTIDIPTTTPDSTSTPTSTPTSTTSTVPTSTISTSSVPIYPIYSQEVVINEIAWAGTSADYPTHEWIELYNPTDQDIKIFSKNASESWKIKVGDYFIGFDKINNGVIAAHGYYLIESIRDEIVREAPADGIYILVYGLNNAGEKIQLIKPDGTISDEVDCSGGWFAGDTIKYRTMERLSPTASGSDPSNWQSNKGPRMLPRTFNGGQIFGSPRSANTGGMLALNIYQEEDDVVLTKDNNPYILGFYTIPAGKRLIIEPGVIIKTYYKNSSINIYGALQINGTSDEPVVFTSGRDLLLDNNLIGQYSDGEPSAKDWQGLWFHTGAIGNLSGLDMRYAGKDFYKDGYIYTVAASEAIRSEGANLNIQNSKFLHNGGKFIHALAGTNLTVENSVFVDGGVAIQVDGGTATLNNNEFLDFTENPPVQVIILH